MPPCVAPGSNTVVVSGSTEIQPFLSVIAPLLAQGQWTEPGLDDTSRVAELRGQVDVQPVDVDGQTVLLCARGGPRGGGAMDRAAEGVARILRVAA